MCSYISKSFSLENRFEMLGTLLSCRTWFATWNSVFCVFTDILLSLKKRRYGGTYSAYFMVKCFEVYLFAAFNVKHAVSLLSKMFSVHACERMQPFFVHFLILVLLWPTKV